MKTLLFISSAALTALLIAVEPEALSSSQAVLLGISGFVAYAATLLIFTLPLAAGLPERKTRPKKKQKEKNEE